jgi:hypothetical protein
MPRERSDASALFDMLQAAEGALRHVADKTREDYEREELLRDAVERLTDGAVDRDDLGAWGLCRLLMSRRLIFGRDSRRETREFKISPTFY